MEALVAFGANLGPADQAYRQAAESLARCPGVTYVQASPLYATLPVGKENQDLGDVFLNGCLRLQTDQSPFELFRTLLDIQHSSGGQHTSWSPRTMDLDLVWTNTSTVESPTLHVPHPRMHHRWFVLRPAADLAPDATHPLLEQTVANLLARVVNPNPKFLLFGGDQDLQSQAANLIRQRFPFAVCQSHPPVRTPIQWERYPSAILGARGEGLDHATWGVVFEELDSASAEGPVLPIVDARPAPEKGPLERLKDGLDSMAIGQRLEMENR